MNQSLIYINVFCVRLSHTYFGLVPLVSKVHFVSARKLYNFTYFLCENNNSINNAVTKYNF